MGDNFNGAFDKNILDKTSWIKILHDQGYNTGYIGKWHLPSEGNNDFWGIDRWHLYGDYYSELRNIYLYLIIHHKIVHLIVQEFLMGLPFLTIAVCAFPLAILPVSRDVMGSGTIVVVYLNLIYAMYVKVIIVLVY